MSNRGLGSPRAGTAPAPAPFASKFFRLGLDLQQHPGASGRDERRKARELDGVAKALLGMQKDGLAGYRLAFPDRERAAVLHDSPAAVHRAILVSVPAALEVAHQEPRHP